MNPRLLVTSTNYSLEERRDGISNSSSGYITRVEGHEMQGEELGELLLERCLESMLNDNRKLLSLEKCLSVPIYSSHILCLASREHVQHTRPAEF
jgi:hypothetical protein